MKYDVVVWGPATIANWGPGYDLLGAAVEGMGDRVMARKTNEHPGEIRIASVTGDGGKLPLDPDKNTAGIAAQEAMSIIGQDSFATFGIELALEKGLPLGSGLGSSGASAAAAAYAVNLLAPNPVDKVQLMPALLKAESAVSGWHADNVAPALLGGFVLVDDYEPLSLQSLPSPQGLHLVLVKPDIAIHTRDARAVVPKDIPLATHIANSGKLGAFVTALFKQDLALLGRSLRDHIVEPARSSLIPGFVEAKQEAMEAGALGCSISGGGPTVFAMADSPEKATLIGNRMKKAFLTAGKVESNIYLTTIDALGTRAL
jgi:homoserine kinase